VRGLVGLRAQRVRRRNCAAPIRCAPPRKAASRTGRLHESEFPSVLSRVRCPCAEQLSRTSVRPAGAGRAFCRFRASHAQPPGDFPNRHKSSRESRSARPSRMGRPKATRSHWTKSHSVTRPPAVPLAEARVDWFFSRLAELPRLAHSHIIAGSMHRRAMTVQTIQPASAVDLRIVPAPGLHER